jgi:uncharacterized protein YebE (UPF0316 family)
MEAVVDLSALFSDDVFRWVVLPLLIFMARILDVSLGTMRIVFVSKGMRYIAPLVGFFEVFIWIVAIKEVMQNLTNIVGYTAYAGGFAMGNYIGLYLEHKIALGSSLIRVITHRDAGPLIDHLKKNNCGVTNIEAQGSRGKVNVIYLIVRRADVPSLINTIQKFHPHAFFTIEDVRQVSHGVFPGKKTLGVAPKLGPFRFFRKGK